MHNNALLDVIQLGGEEMSKPNCNGTCRRKQLRRNLMNSFVINLCDKLMGNDNNAEGIIE